MFLYRDSGKEVYARIREQMRLFDPGEDAPATGCKKYRCLNSAVVTNSIESTNSGKNKCLPPGRNKWRIFPGGGIFPTTAPGRKKPCAVSMLRFDSTYSLNTINTSDTKNISCTIKTLYFPCFRKTMKVK